MSGFDLKNLPDPEGVGTFYAQSSAAGDLARISGGVGSYSDAEGHVQLVPENSWELTDGAQLGTAFSLRFGLSVHTPTALNAAAVRVADAATGDLVLTFSEGLLYVNDAPGLVYGAMFAEGGWFEVRRPPGGLYELSWFDGSVVRLIGKYVVSAPSGWDGVWVTSGVSTVTLREIRLASALLPTPLGPTASAAVAPGAAVGELVVLDGSASKSPASRPLSYEWELVDQPAGSAAQLSGIAPAKGVLGGVHLEALTPGAEGNGVSFVVKDDAAYSSLSITYDSDARRFDIYPARAGDFVVSREDDLVAELARGAGAGRVRAFLDTAVDGSAPLAITAAAALAGGSDSSTATCVFLPNAPGRYAFQLTVSDGSLSAQASVTFDVAHRGMPLGLDEDLRHFWEQVPSDFWGLYKDDARTIERFWSAMSRRVADLFTRAAQVSLFQSLDAHPDYEILRWAALPLLRPVGFEHVAEAKVAAFPSVTALSEGPLLTSRVDLGSTADPEAAWIRIGEVLHEVRSREGAVAVLDPPTPAFTVIGTGFAVAEAERVVWVDRQASGFDGVIIDGVYREVSSSVAGPAGAKLTLAASASSLLPGASSEVTFVVDARQTAAESVFVGKLSGIEELDVQVGDVLEAIGASAAVSCLCWPYVGYSPAKGLGSVRAPLVAEALRHMSRLRLPLGAVSVPRLVADPARAGRAGYEYVQGSDYTLQDGYLSFASAPPELERLWAEEIRISPDARLEESLGSVIGLKADAVPVGYPAALRVAYHALFSGPGAKPLRALTGVLTGAAIIDTPGTIVAIDQAPYTDQGFLTIQDADGFHWTYAFPRVQGLALNEATGAPHAVGDSVGRGDPVSSAPVVRDRFSHPGFDKPYVQAGLLGPLDYLHTIEVEIPPHLSADASPATLAAFAERLAPARTSVVVALTASAREDVAPRERAWPEIQVWAVDNPSGVRGEAAAETGVRELWSPDAEDGPGGASFSADDARSDGSKGYIIDSGMELVSGVVQPDAESAEPVLCSDPLALSPEIRALAETVEYSAGWQAPTSRGTLLDDNSGILDSGLLGVAGPPYIDLVVDGSPALTTTGGRLVVSGWLLSALTTELTPYDLPDAYVLDWVAVVHQDPGYVAPATVEGNSVDAGPFQTIEAAFQACRDADLNNPANHNRVYIMDSGTYNESVKWAEPDNSKLMARMQLVGAPGELPVLEGAGSGTGLSVWTDALLRNFEIRNFEDGVALISSTAPYGLEGMTFSDLANGAQGLKGGYARRCVFRDITQTALSGDSNWLAVYGCVFIRCKTAAFMLLSPIDMRFNTLHECTTMYQGAAPPTFIGNIVSNAPTADPNYLFVTGTGADLTNVHSNLFWGYDVDRVDSRGDPWEAGSATFPGTDLAPTYFMDEPNDDLQLTAQAVEAHGQIARDALVPWDALALSRTDPTSLGAYDIVLGSITVDLVPYGAAGAGDPVALTVVTRPAAVDPAEDDYETMEVEAPDGVLSSGKHLLALANERGTTVWSHFKEIV